MSSAGCAEKRLFCSRFLLQNNWEGEMPIFAPRGAGGDLFGTISRVTSKLREKELGEELECEEASSFSMRNPLDDYEGPARMEKEKISQCLLKCWASVYWELAGRRAGDPCEVHQDLLCSEVLPLWQGPSRAALLCRAGAPAARRSPGWYLVLSTRSHTHTQTLLSLFCACFCCAARLGSSLAAWWHTESFTGDAHGATAKLFTFNRGLSQGRSDTLPAICVFHRAQYTSPAPCSCVFLV